MLAVIALCPFAAHAQGGSEALPFVRTDLGPMLTGAAGAAVASPEAGPWSAFRSAAAIPMSETVTSAGIDGRIFGALPGGAAAISVKPTDNIGFAIGLMYQSGDKISDYRTSDVLMSAGAGIGISEVLSVGLNARFARQNLTEGVAYKGMSMDLSVMGRFSESVSAIAGLSTLGGKVTSASGTQYSQPANAYAGAEFRMDILDGVLCADAMAEYYFSGSCAAAVGAVYTYQETVTLRGGFRYASQWCVMPTLASIGAGYSYENISIDLSYQRISSANVLALGISFKFK